MKFLRAFFPTFWTLGAFCLLACPFAECTAQDGGSSGPEPVPYISEIPASFVSMRNSEPMPDVSGSTVGIDEGTPGALSASASELLRQAPEHRKSFFQGFSLNQSFTSASGDAEELGLVHFGTNVLFAAPMPWDAGALILAPNFMFDHFYEMPSALKMKDSLYRAGVSLTWRKEVNEFWNIMAFISPTFSSDLENTSSDAIRLPGGGVAVWTPTPHWQFSLGVAYTGMEEWAVTPIGGFIWQPNEDWKLDCTFPKPRLCRRIEPFAGHSPFWVYLAGEFFGGTWAVDLAGRNDLATYREVRIMFGVERDRPKLGELDIKLELGIALWRKLEFEDSDEVYHPDLGFVENLIVRF